MVRRATPVVPVDPEKPAAPAVERAAAVLRAGGIVGLPTETVYGLAANACDAEAVRRIFEAKQRPPDNPLIVHVASVDALGRVARTVPPLAAELAARWWPGPLSLIVDAASGVPSITRGGLDTVAVRMPAHPVALAVLRVADLPLAAPSANRSGRPSPTTAAHVIDDLGGRVDLVLDAGRCRVGLESTVVDARGGRPIILRAGAITAEDLGLPPAPPALSGNGASPGTRYRHYAPACQVEIAPAGQGPALAAVRAAGGARVGLIAPGHPPAHVLPLARPRDAADLAHVLFDAFRAAEDADLDAVIVEAVPEEGLGVAVMDRIRRAAHG
jgi:L-threonylcarbamoyladenylate synthase